MSAKGRSTRSDESHVFVLRLWFEPGGDGGGEWRGEIRDVTTRARVAFRHLEGLAAAVRELGVDGR